jgi:hypothetical protein
MPQKPDRDWQEVRIRRSTGDTQKLRALFVVPERIN